MRIFLVEATFKARRNKVEINKTDGNVEKSKGFLEYKATNMIITDVARERARSKSRMNGLMGTIMTNKIIKIPPAAKTSGPAVNNFSFFNVSFIFHLHSIKILS
jgi:hypothetical protein